MSVVEKELRAICEEDGGLSPHAVLYRARDEAHPLHARFEWDDTEAGEAYRLIQAAHLIRSVKITVSDPSNKEPVTVRAFVHIPRDEAESEDAPASTYMPQEVVAASPALSAIALRQMETRWKQLRRTYQDHAEFWALVKQDVSSAA